MNRNLFEDQSVYEQPTIVCISVQTERGFADSDSGWESDTNPEEQI